MAEYKQEEPELFIGFQDSPEELISGDSKSIGASDSAVANVLPEKELQSLFSIGEKLKNLRLERRMEIREVEDVCRIKSEYILALENGDVSALPQLVYVLAYVKKLCDIYGVPADETKAMTEAFKKHLAPKITEAIGKSVYGHEGSEESERKLRRIALLLLAGSVLILLLISGGVALLVTRLSGNGEYDLPFDSERLIRIQGNVELSTPMLPPVE